MAPLRNNANAGAGRERDRAERTPSKFPDAEEPAPYDPPDLLSPCSSRPKTHDHRSHSESLRVYSRLRISNQLWGRRMKRRTPWASSLCGGNGNRPGKWNSPLHFAWTERAMFNADPSAERDDAEAEIRHVLREDALEFGIGGMEMGG